jgi:hypothetical protein
LGGWNEHIFGFAFSQKLLPKICNGNKHIEKLFENFVENCPENKQIVHFLAYPPPKHSQNICSRRQFLGERFQEINAIIFALCEKGKIDFRFNPTFSKGWLANYVPWFFQNFPWKLQGFLGVYS